MVATFTVLVYIVGVFKYAPHYIFDVIPLVSKFYWGFAHPLVDILKLRDEIILAIVLASLFV